MLLLLLLFDDDLRLFILIHTETTSIFRTPLQKNPYVSTFVSPVFKFLVNKFHL